MTATDASAPGGSSRLLNPRRSAHATIRGYLYQTCLGVLRWLDLQPNEILLCEGDEDLDRFLLGGGSVSEQVKAYTGGLSLSDKAVLESLGNFLRSYVALRRRGETRSFVFTTTAQEKKTRNTGLDFDLLEAWKEGNRTKKAVNSVRSLLKPKKSEKGSKETTEAIAWLDAEPDGWKGFMDAVEWSFDAPDLDAVRDRIKSRVALRDDTKLLSAEIFRDRLIARVLDASIQSQPQDRTLTSRILSDVIGTAERDLGEWAKTPEADRLRTVFDELKQVQRLLHDNTATIPERASPGKLLTAAYEVIPFDEAGRREELDFLTRWCENGDPRSVLLLTGEGGSGKTRLMIEWCRHLRHVGWHAGFLRPDRKAEDLDPLLEGSAPRLVVLDDAETRLGVLDPMLLKMGLAAEGQGPKLRLVLLARRKADWWENLSHGSSREIEDLLLGSPEPREITSLVPKDATDREKAFRVAMEGFAVQLDLKVPRDLHIPDLSEGKFDRVLYLHMAALAALRGERIETAESALEQVLDQEQLFWRNRVSDLGLDRSLISLMNKAVESAVAAFTLVGGARTLQHAQALLNRVLKDLPLQPHHPATVRELLRDLYAGSRGADGRYIDPLRPDLLGEELVAEALNRDGELLGRILDGAGPEEAYSTLTVLTRLAQRRPEFDIWLGTALHGRLEALAEIALDVAVETGDPLGFKLAEEINSLGSLEVIKRIQERCDSASYRRSLPLREVALVVTEKSLELLRDSKLDLDEGTQSEYARLASNLGIRLSEIGRREDALYATQEAVEIWRKLARRKPNAFLPDLAMSLNNLGIWFGELGQHKDALNATQEGVKIWRKLVRRGPDAFLPDLAKGLNNLGVRFSELGQHKDALNTTKEAVEIRRELARRKPDAFLPDLAMSLNNLGNSLSEREQHDDALDPAQEAVDIYRKLALQRPDASLPNLAMSLTSLGKMLHEKGRREDAFNVTKEAVEIYRKLALRRPDAFLPKLAMSLSNLGQSLSELKREGALSATQEAVEIRRKLALRRPDAFLPELANSLNNLGTILSELRRHEGAVQAIEEALQILTPFFLRLPLAFRDAMAKMVSNYREFLEAADQNPKEELLHPILEVLNSLET